MNQFSARKKVLPRLDETELTEADDFHAKKIDIESKGKRVTYYVRPKTVPGEVTRRGSEPSWVPSRFHLYPLILHGDCSPWPEANLWILSTLEGKVQPNMASFSSIAEDMAAYLRFLEEKGIDWLHFPPQKLYRPTYRFNGHLKSLIQSEDVAIATAKRRMGTVIRFYRWLVEEELFAPEHAPWRETDHYVEFKGRYGEARIKQVTSTDISIRVPQQDDPYDMHIEDGGKLRPLPQNEQEWLWDALISRGNTEMTLIHAFAMLTGARIQTILTFRVHHVLKDLRSDSDGCIRYPVGSGTGIDTKYDKKLVLHIPAWFYDKLKIYALSERARKRRSRAIGGDQENQYLFLSIRGAPLYTSRDDNAQVESRNLSHNKVGQGVRQFMTSYIIPFIRRKYDRRFNYQFHDLRATYGMNLLDERMTLVEKNKTTLKEVMLFLQSRLGHASQTTTELYLNYRSRLQMIRAVQDEWEAKLQSMVRGAMESISG